MSVADIFDAVATRARTMTGLNEVYTVTGTPQDDGTLLAIPTSFDSDPVGALMPVTGELTAGNTEKFVHQLELQIWKHTAESNPLDVLLFVERARVMFRTDLEANGTATRVLFKGYSPLRAEQMNGQPYLVLPLRFEFMETAFTHAYSVT